MKLIRGKKDIPVPDVKAWGLAADNEFGLDLSSMMPVVKVSTWTISFKHQIPKTI